MSWKKQGLGNFVKWETEGQSLEGIWKGQHDGKFGPLGDIETADGLKTFPLHTALLNQTENFKEGCLIRIEYKGKSTSKQGREFKAFDVWLDEPDAQA